MCTSIQNRVLCLATGIIKCPGVLDDPTMTEICETIFMTKVFHDSYVDDARNGEENNKVLYAPGFVIMNQTY